MKDASAGVLNDLKRFQKEKEEDLKRYMVRALQLSTGSSICPNRVAQVAYARCHLDWAKKNLETWTEAKDEVDKIEVR